MTEHQRAWKKYLISDGDIIVSRAARMAAWQMLYDEYAGLPRKDLIVIWDNLFAKTTKAYFKSLRRFPDAMEKTNGGLKRWAKNYDRKRAYFIRRMEGLTHVKGGIANVKPSTLVSRIEDLAGEILSRHESLTPREMVKILRAFEKLTNTFHRHHRAAIKAERKGDHA